MLQGYKYIIRTELMYERVPSALSPASQPSLLSPTQYQKVFSSGWSLCIDAIQMCALYEQADRCFKAGDADGYVEYYIKAMSLNIKLAYPFSFF